LIATSPLPCDHDRITYTRLKVAATRAAQGLPAKPDDAVLDVVAAMIAARPNGLVQSEAA